jgi:UDP-glucose 4-epimerase
MDQPPVATHLILGGCGFIGRHVALRLLREGERVVLADRQSLSEKPPCTRADLLSFRAFDLTSVDWDSLIADCNVIHHYAWSTLPQTANEDPVSDLCTNVSSTISLLEAMRRCGGKRLVFASSGGTVYGRLRQIPVREDDALNPVTAYGVSKLAAEKYLGLYRDLHGLDCRVARISNPFGAGQDPRRNQGAVTTFLLKALASERITIWGDGEVVRDYIHISDVTRALAALASVALDPYPDLPVFNIGSGGGTSLNQVIKCIERHLSRRIDVDYLPPRRFDIPVNILDVTRAQKVLGWRPALSFDEAIEVAIEDMRGQTSSFSTLV